MLTSVVQVRDLWIPSGYRISRQAGSMHAGRPMESSEVNP